MAVTAAQLEAFAAAAEANIANAVALGSQASTSAASLMNQSILDLTARMRALPPEQWTFSALGELRAQVAATAEEMGAALNAQARRALREFADLGTTGTMGAAIESGVLSSEIATGFAVIEPAMVNILSGLTTPLIDGITAGVQAQIEQAISTGILTGGGQLETMAAIDRALFSGNVGSWVTRSETIFRTETLRAYSLTQDVRNQQLERTFPGSDKKWLTTLDGRERESHRRMHNKVIKFNERFVIQPGTSKSGKTVKGGPARLKYPRDPTGLGSPRAVARETIMCRCAHIMMLKRGATARRGTARSVGAEVRTIRTDVEDFTDAILS